MRSLLFRGVPFCVDRPAAFWILAREVDSVFFSFDARYRHSGRLSERARTDPEDHDR